MNRKLFYLLAAYIAVSGNIQAAKEIDLGRTLINPNYIEIEKLNGTKEIVVIEKKDIQERGYTSLSEVLNTVPGVNVGASDWGEIDIRGQGKDQAAKNIQVMLDGAPITTLVSHPYKTNYDVIPVDQIEKIEIIPGGGSVLYGSGTAGGVINITTNLKAMSKPINKVGLEVSQNLENRQYVNLGSKLGEKTTVQVNFSNSYKKLYFRDTYDKNRYFSVGANQAISDNQNISFKYSLLEEDGQFIKNVSKANLEAYGKNYVPRLKNKTVGLDEHNLKITKKIPAYLSSKRKHENLKLSYAYNYNENTSFSLDLFKMDGYFTQNDDEDKRMNQETVGGKAKLDIMYGENNSVLLGFDYFKQNAELKYPDYKIRKDENGKTIKYKGKLTYNKLERKFTYDKYVQAPYILNIVKMNDFEFTQGIRWDISEWKFDKNAADGEGKGSVRRVNHNYELSTGYNYRDTGKVYIRYERGFTAPDGLQISDRILDADGNKVYVKTKAKDEIFDIYEAGWREYIFGTGIDFTIFYNKTDNQLNRVYRNGIKESLTVNYLKTKRYGAELSLRQEFDKLSLEESYSYLKGKTGYNSNIPEADKKVNWADSGLEKVPTHKFTVKVDYKVTENLTAGIVWKYRGKYNNFFNEASKEEDSLVKSNTIVDLSIRYNHPSGIGIYGGIANIGDVNYYSYQTAGDSKTVIPANGRTYFGGISYQF